VFGNKVSYGLHEHFLLRPSQFDTQLLECHNSGIARIEVAAKVKLGLSAGACGGAYTYHAGLRSRRSIRLLWVGAAGRRGSS
jgi:hypothetical protein